MYDTLLFMQIQHCFCNLSDDMSTEIFAEIGQSNYLVKEFAARAQLKDDEVVLA